MSLIIKRALEAQRVIDIPEEHILGWTAGFLEGDGHFCITNARGYVYFRITALQVHKPPVNTLHRLYGGGLRLHGKNIEGQNAIWTWQLNGIKAVKLAREIYPLMSPKRQKQIDDALSKVLRSV